MSSYNTTTLTCVWTETGDRNTNCTHPCLSTLFGLFFDCKLSSDFAVYRLFCSIAEDGLFVGEVTAVVTKSPVLFHRFASPVGLFCDAAFDGMTLLLLIKLPLLVIFVECTDAGRGSGEGAGDVLLWESAECSEPFDWWCNDLLFKLETLVEAWNLDGEFVVVLLLLLLLRRKRQSSSVEAVDVIWVERTLKWGNLNFIWGKRHKNIISTHLYYFLLLSRTSWTKMLMKLRGENCYREYWDA